MKAVFVSIALIMLNGCQLLPEPAVPEPAAVPVAVSEPTTEPVVEPQPEPPLLRIADDAKTLLAWVDYRASLLHNVAAEREQVNSSAQQDDVWLLKRTMLQLHPDTPYLTRLRLQMQAADQLTLLPPPLAALLSWDLAFNQKLLEAESAVSALTRLNAQQHDNIERLQKTNKELQKKIDALTQIEAQLNQPVPAEEDNNGQR